MNKILLKNLKLVSKIRGKNTSNNDVAMAIVGALSFLFNKEFR